jgi:hypothetical protein
MRGVWLPLLLLLLGCAGFVGLYGDHSDAFYGDALGYYSYLPSLLLHGDAGQAHQDMEAKGYPPRVQYYFRTLSTLDSTPTGEYIVQYTIGVAIMEAPFFALARLVHALTGIEASGYGPMHQAFRQMAGWTYVSLGLAMLWSLMGREGSRNRQTSDHHARGRPTRDRPTDTALRSGLSPQARAWTVFFLVLGSNLLWFLACQPGMAHPVSFFLVALLLWATERAYRLQQTRDFALVGLSLGLLTLIRPTDAVFVLVPLCYGRQGLSRQAAWIWRMRSRILWTVLIGALVLVPQLLFWKAHTGQWVYYSYNEQGFFWDQPRIYKGLFSYQNGWFSYTPLMALALLSMPLALRYRALQAWLRPGLFLLPVLIYVTYSWWCWYYMNGFGSRPMIHVYPLMALFLGGLMERLNGAWKGPSKLAKILSTTGFILLTICSLWSLVLERHVALQQLLPAAGNQHYVERLAFRRSPTYDDLILWDTRQRQPDTSAFGERFWRVAPDSVLVPVRTEANEEWHTGLTWTIPESTTTGSATESAAESAAAGPESQRRWWRLVGRFRSEYNQGDLYRQHSFVLQVLHRESADRKGDGAQDNEAWKQLLWKQVRINNKLGIPSFEQNGCRVPDRQAATNLYAIGSGTWYCLDFWVPVPEGLEAGDRVNLQVWNKAGIAIESGGFGIEEAWMPLR